MNKINKAIGLLCGLLLAFMVPTICLASNSNNALSSDISVDNEYPNIVLTPIDVQYYQYCFEINGNINELSIYGMPVSKTTNSVTLTNEQFCSMYDAIANLKCKPSLEYTKNLYAKYYDYYQNDYTEVELNSLVNSLGKDTKYAIKNGPNIIINYPEVVSEVKVENSVSSIYTQTDHFDRVCFFDGQASTFYIYASFNKEPGVYTYCQSASVDNYHCAQYPNLNLLYKSANSIYYSRTYPSQASCYTNVSFDYWSDSNSKENYYHTFNCSLN